MSVDLEAIRARCEGATDGPWFATTMPYGQNAKLWHVYASDNESYTGAWLTGYGGPPLAESDADFIAHARSDVPALLSVVEIMTDALLETEVRSTGSDVRECGGCGMRTNTGTEARTVHSVWCPIDVALTTLGLDTQEKRDQARKAGR